MLLLLTFACFYYAINPGNFFSIDEAMEQETAQALILRRTIDIPVMVDARFGRGKNWYTVKGPGLPMVSLPFVYLGIKLDDAFGSLNGGQLAGPPVGPEQQPLRWSGRLAISSALIVNAIAGGAIVAVLFMVGTQLSPKPRAAMLMAIAAGLGTLVMSEATHFYQHELDALMVILAFWFFSAKNPRELMSSAIFGGLSLGVAILARPDAVPAAVIIWLYGVAVAWKLVRDLPDRWPRMMRRTLLAVVGPMGAVAGTMYFNYLRFGSVLQFGYTEDRARFVLDLRSDRQSDRRLSCQSGPKCFSFRATTDSCCGSGPQGLSPLAAGDDDADSRGDSASVDDCVQQDLERRFIIRTAVHAGVDRIADAADAACIRDGG